MSEINKYYLSLLQEIRTMQDTAENGASQEQLFTQIALEMLAEAGETENATFAYDEKELGTKGQHKINGYAMSDNYETIDLFISIFQNTEVPQKITKEEMDGIPHYLIDELQTFSEKHFIMNMLKILMSHHLFFNLHMI